MRQLPLECGLVRCIGVGLRIFRVPLSPRRRLGDDPRARLCSWPRERREANRRCWRLIALSLIRPPMFLPSPLNAGGTLTDVAPGWRTKANHFDRFEPVVRLASVGLE